jgi:SAM-dependent methyltransferase
MRHLRNRLRRGLLRARSLFGKYRCAVCGNRVSRFRCLAATHPETAQNLKKHGFRHVDETFNEDQYSCPFCGACDRDRMYALYLNKYLAGASAQIRIVDFAPLKSLSQFIRRKLESLGGAHIYRTADLYDPQADDKVDLMDMKLYEEGEFDFFICSHVLEHVEDDRKALSELFRITRPGGWGIAMVPIALGLQDIDEDPRLTDESERWRRFGQNDHVRLYSKQGFLDRLVEAGFEVQQLGADYFGKASFEENAIDLGSVLYVVSRPGSDVRNSDWVTVVSAHHERVPSEVKT